MRLGDLPALLPEVVRVLAALVRTERDRIGLGTRPAVERARSRGLGSPLRDARARAALRRAVALVDACCPGGPNCLRRALLEASLDGGAAREPIYLHLSASGGPGASHARLASVPADGRRYDATFAV